MHDTLRVQLTKVSAATGAHTDCGYMEITQINDKSEELGEYSAVIFENRGGISKRIGSSLIYRWPRKTRGIWDLVGEILERRKNVQQ